MPRASSTSTSMHSSGRRRSGRQAAKAPRDGDFPGQLLAWYDRHRRHLPWRALPGERPDPYRVWLSEIMLQQTTVRTVGPYFTKFVAQWPAIDELARASLDEVLHAWQGLGYYSRARNLLACARLVSGERGGNFPDTEAELAMLPGIGPYTAAAIAAIAFDRRAVVVDGNIERVLARLRAVEEPLPGAKQRLRQIAAAVTPDQRCGDFAQAMMDLGATICTPRRPRCILCPVRAECRARAAGTAEALPRREPRAPRPLRRGVAFFLARAGGEVMIRRRPEKGLLGGLMEIPTTAWRSRPWTTREAIDAAPAPAPWRELPGIVRHVFTHFELELTVFAGELGSGEGDGTRREKGKNVGETTEGTYGANEGQEPRWCRLDRLSNHALPSLMKKVVAHALANGGSGSAAVSTPRAED